MKKILIFYSETGGGHLRAAQALAEEISLHKGFEVVLYDGLKKTNWGQKTNPSLVFTFILNYLLPLYNLTYILTDNYFGLTILRKIVKSIWGENFKKIIHEEKPNLVITTHHFISPSTFVDLDKKIPFVVVVVDLGRPHRIWFDDKADFIVVPDKKMAKWAIDKFQITLSKIRPLGYPFGKQFRKASPLKFKDQILILGAGIKTRFVKKWIKKIQKEYPNSKIIVICGHNHKLQENLSKIKGIETYGFVNNLYQFFKKADMVITKAGPALIMEAKAIKIPLIIVKWVGLQEKDNVEFVLSNNLGLYDPNGKNLTLSISEIYKNYRNYTQGRNMVSFETGKIAKYLTDLIS